MHQIYTCCLYCFIFQRIAVLLIHWIIIFAARCYASASYAIMRCLCVCLSVTFLHSVKTNKDIFKIFSLSGSHTILVFPYQTGWRYSDRNPRNGGVKCRWGRQKPRFWAYIWLDCLCWRCNRPGVVNMVAGGPRPPSRKLWHIAGIKLRCWLREKTTKCLWQ